MQRRILVTGLSGFVGQSMTAMCGNGDNRLLSPGDADVTQPSTLEAAISDPPDAVIHLAAQSFVPQSFADPRGTFDTNFLGTYNLLARLKQVGFKGAFLLVSSGDVYGPVHEASLPITEDQHPKPGNPYAVSKLAAEALCRQWAACEPEWRILIARPFNHIGAGQSERFVVSGIARQVARIRLGLQPPEIEAGDIDVTRDFLDVRDVLAGYFALLDKGTSGETYNVCSGKETSIRDIIGNMCSLAGIEAGIRQDPSRFRPAEQRRVAGSCDKISTATGWRASIPLDATLDAILTDWTQRISQ